MPVEINFKKYPRVGDVIRSSPTSKTEVKIPSFAFGKKGKNGIIWLIHSKNNANDQTRTEAEFVVESAGSSGGGTYLEQGGGISEVPTYWVVHARRLENGKYNPEGELIGFEMGRYYHNDGDDNFIEGVIPPEDVTILRKMQRIVTFVETP